jgi:hypothetical protein
MIVTLVVAKLQNSSSSSQSHTSFEMAVPQPNDNLTSRANPPIALKLNAGNQSASMQILHVVQKLSLLFTGCLAQVCPQP